MTTSESPTAVGSGTAATDKFLQERVSADTPPERVSAIAKDVLEHSQASSTSTASPTRVPRPQAVAHRHRPVRRVAPVAGRLPRAQRRGGRVPRPARHQGKHRGPYYVADAKTLPAKCELPMRDNEVGSKLVFEGQVRDLDGKGGLGGATVELWHADDEATTPISRRTSPTATSAERSSPTTRDASRSRRFSLRRTRSRPTAPPPAGSSRRPAGTRGVRLTCTSW